MPAPLYKVRLAQKALSLFEPCNLCDFPQTTFPTLWYYFVYNGNRVYVRFYRLRFEVVMHPYGFFSPLRFVKREISSSGSYRYIVYRGSSFADAFKSFRSACLVYLNSYFELTETSE